MRRVALIAALSLIAAGAHAQGYGSAVNVWGNDSVTGAPCLIGISTTAATCVLQTTPGGGGGGGGAVTAAAGAYKVGSLLDGADATQGVTTDAACAGDTTSGCTLEARIQRLAQRLTTINGTLGSPLQAGGSVVPTASSTGGMLTSSKQVANNTTSVAIDASPGTLYQVRVWNNSATIAYAKLYNAAQGSTTCGSGTPLNRILIPANTSGAGATIPFGAGLGVAYGTAISLCVTTGFADSDTTSPAASTYIVEVDYK